MMDNICAPQWADLTRSPQVLSDDYFEVQHEIHKPQIHFKPIVKSSLPCKESNATEASVLETNFDDSLESVQNACTSIAYFIPNDNKEQLSSEVDKKNDFDNAVEDLKLDSKSNKIHQTWIVSIDELISTFKKSTINHKAKTTVAEKIRHNICISDVKTPVMTQSSLKGSQTVNVDKSKQNVSSINLIQAKSKQTVNSGHDCTPECVKNNVSRNKFSNNIAPIQNRQSTTFKAKQRTLGTSYPRILTCQYRRKSLMKYRRCSNQFISLAEAVSRFQNGTPQRFRTISNRNLKSGSLMKLKQPPLKLTHPVSPALRSKKRARPTTILSQQERENLELKEMKKHQIKANPIPLSILKAPCVLKKVTKKPGTVTQEFHLTQTKKTRHTTSLHVNPKSAADNKGHNYKNCVPITRSVSASNVATKKDNTCTEPCDKDIKPVKNSSPNSFVTRNKEYQMKKEEKLKNLHDQETNKIKNEFHARPAPKFSKPTNVVKEQSEKKHTIPCPFSFIERDKAFAKRKEELVKHMQQKDKEIPVFHANPIPNFKSVVVYGLSKENIQNKKESLNNFKKLIPRRTQNCNNEENKEPNILAKTIISTNTKKKNEKQYTNEFCENQSVSTARQNAASIKNEKSKVIQRTKFELNIDKRVKERNEIVNKMKKREQEQKTKKKEEEKQKLLKEKLEKAELHKLTEIKARPMPIYKSLSITKSTKPLITPQSPAWANRNKLRGVS